MTDVLPLGFLILIILTGLPPSVFRKDENIANICELAYVLESPHIDSK